MPGEWTEERDAELVERWPWVAESMSDAGGYIVEVKGSLIRDLRAAWLEAEKRGDAALARVKELEAVLVEPSPEDAEMLGEAARRRWVRHDEDGAPPPTESLYASIVRAVLAELRARVGVTLG